MEGNERNWKIFIFHVSDEQNQIHQIEYKNSVFKRKFNALSDLSGIVSKIKKR